MMTHRPWIKHDRGNESPAAPDTVVEVLYRAWAPGAKWAPEEVGRAKYFNWLVSKGRGDPVDRVKGYTDIVAWRIAGPEYAPIAEGRVPGRGCEDWRGVEYGLKI